MTLPSDVSKVLSGHVSSETAYVSEDYPYGFTLRCKIRYWLEYKSGYGFRLVSQTTNPKKPGEVWNKPKASTYADLGVMYLDGKGHVHWAAANVYHTPQELKAFYEVFGAGLQDLPSSAIYAALLRYAEKVERRNTVVAEVGA